MDWITVLFIIFFFVLPVIQQVLGQARKGRRVPPEWEQMGDDESHAPTPWRRVEEPSTPPASDGGWSEGWGRWPGSADDLDGQDSETPERVEPEWARSHGLEPAKPVPAKPEATSSLPSLPTPAALPVREPVAPARRGIAAPVRRIVTHHRARPDVRHALHHPAEVRKALILREILNPPLSLRESDPELP